MPVLVACNKIGVICNKAHIVKRACVLVICKTISKTISILIYFIYYCHKVKHVPFDNTTKVLGTVRTETFERYQKFTVADNKRRISAIC